MGWFADRSGNTPYAKLSTRTGVLHMRVQSKPRVRNVVLAAVIVLASITAVADATSQSPTRYSFRPRFRPAASHVAQIWTTGAYAFFQTSTQLGGILLDDRTGMRTTLERQGCGVGTGQAGYRPASPLGGSWVLFNCGTNQRPAPLLYSVTGRGTGAQ